MFSKAIPLFKLRGFQVNLDASWLILAFLITWTLAVSYFPMQQPGLSPAAYWAMGVGGALGLFVSIVLHELGHATIARRDGVPMKGITLFLFGGVAQMDREPPTAKSEFRMAIAGPIVSYVLAAVFYVAYGLAQGSGAPAAAVGVLLYLAVINAVLATFNLLPAFPLDGGRVLRSALWARNKDLRKATRTASQAGSFFGILFIVLGVMSIFGGNFIGGMWWALIGMFLRGASQMSYRQVEIREALEGTPVSQFMKTDPVTVRPDLSVQELVDDYVYRHHHHMFPVVSGPRLKGCVSTGQIKNVPKEQWPHTTVAQIFAPCSEENTIAPSTDSMKALAQMQKTGNSRMLVAEDENLIGVVTLKDLLGFLAVKLDLDSGAKTSTPAEWRKAA